MIDFLQQYIGELQGAFFNPEKRVFVGYLAAAAGIALVWLLLVSRQSFAASCKTLFSAKVWWSRSAKADYLVFLCNRVFMLLLAPRLVSQLAIATALYFWLHEFWGGRPLLLAQAPDWVIGVLFTFCLFVVDDFSRYLVHRLLHEWPLLWAFHKVHHSAQTLTPMTVFRSHPMEAVIFSLRSICVQAGMIALFVFLLGDRAELVALFGANLFIFFFNVLGANLRHSHIPIYYWQPLEKLFLSPAQHQIHHSVDKKHWNKNYGVVLAIWDRLGGSHHHAEREEPLSFGLNAGQNAKSHSLQQIYLQPCLEALRILRRNGSKGLTCAARLARAAFAPLAIIRVNKKPKDSLSYE